MSSILFGKDVLVERIQERKEEEEEKKSSFVSSRFFFIYHIFLFFLHWIDRVIEAKYYNING
jgi:hypothetical protein